MANPSKREPALLLLPRLWLTLGYFVFFTQQSLENRSTSLCEGPFFIAPGEVIGNFMHATEGGIPMSRFPVTDRTFEDPSHRLLSCMVVGGVV
jgi:hypothetical protein